MQNVEATCCGMVASIPPSWPPAYAAAVRSSRAKLRTASHTNELICACGHRKVMRSVDRASVVGRCGNRCQPHDWCEWRVSWVGGQ